MTRGQSLILVASWMVMLAACTSSRSEPPDTLPPLPPDASSVPEPADDAAATTASLATPGPSPGRLLVTDPEGNMLVGESGDLRVVVPSPGDGQTRQPTWSPDGGRFAYSLLDETGAWLVVADASGTELERFSTPFVSFYLAWNPDGTRVGALGSLGGTDVGFGFADLEAGTFEATAAGRTFFFDWSPDGSRIIAHIGGERLVILDTDGTELLLPVQPGVFQAPQWTPDGTSLIVAIAAPVVDNTSAGGGNWYSGGVRAQRPGQQLLRIDLEREEVAMLLDFEGQIAFELDPDGSRLAYTLTGLEVEGPVGLLAILDLEDRSVVRVSDQTVLGFEWSPNGERLLYMTTSPETTDLVWNVYDGSQTTQFSPHTPTSTFVFDYLQFWGQYARSMTMWAPDGSAFVYPIINATGGGEVWVQRIDGSEPALVGPGLMASWAPSGP